MALDLSFKQLYDFVKKDDPKLLDAIDKLSGIILICGPVLAGPEVAALLPTLAVKNEVVKLAKSVCDSLFKKKDSDYVVKQQRMQISYGLICFTSFFDALDRQLPEELRQKIGLLAEEKVFLVETAQRKSTAKATDISSGQTTLDASNPFRTLLIPFPHPTETLAEQIGRHTQLWKEMAQGFYQFVQKLAFWEEGKEKEKIHIRSVVEKIPQVAANCFEAQYFELARRYQDFAVWANLREHKGAKELIASLSEYVRQQALLAEFSKNSIDIGFVKLHEAVISIPETLKISQAIEIVGSLTRHYNARIVEPIAEEKDEPAPNKPRLFFPRVADAFIPQSFRVLCQKDKTRRLEDESTWKDLDRRNDLGAFLLSYFSSPYSTETPLIILGHPGSGKSLLTTVLSAQLMSKHYVPIRVPLREVDAEAGIVAQIEERIRRITNISVDSWAKLSGAFKNAPPIVILDGYDELLQASGKVFSGYLKDVQNFQKNEAEQGRPVRVIVTSRITLIDKATIPPGSTIVRLLEFDKRQRDAWISIWNRENVSYFKATKIKEFALPRENDDSAAKVLSLAEQPLLLLMLALYDSQGNQLRKSKSLDRTILYDSLLRRFVARERAKEREFNELGANEQKRELDFEMQRLAVAALGMYNRRKLHILSPELNDDLKFFNLERIVAITAGRPLTQADLLLGSFFFVHKSKAQHKAGATEHHEETAAFEFLHNTFGEFLTADFILRQALAEVEALKALKENEVLRAQLEQRLGAADGFSRSWFASLVYTPLFSRPVVLEMMREWVGHILKSKNFTKEDFLSNLDTIIINQVKRLLNKREMPSIIRKEAAQEGYRAPFGDHPLLGHIAIYSINLILLRSIVDGEPFVFDENQIGTHEDGARPWDRLTNIWRSWFALENLNGVTAVMLAERRESKILVRSREKFQVAESQNRLETSFNVGIALGDNISSGVTGLLLFEPSKSNQLGLEDIAQRLGTEKIDLDFHVIMKRLFLTENNISSGGLRDFCNAAAEATKMAVYGGRHRELEQISLSIRRGIQRSMRGADRIVSSRDTITAFRYATEPHVVCEISKLSPSAALILLKLAKEIGDWEWTLEFRRIFTDTQARQIYSMESFDRSPERALEWVQLVHEAKIGPFLRQRDIEFFERAFDLRYLLELTQINPEAALVWTRVVRELSAGHFWELYSVEHFERSFNPHYLLELTQRNPETALEWMQIVRELGAGRFLERYGYESLQHVFNSHYLIELTQRNPDAVLALIQIAREVGDGRFLKRFNDEYFEQVFDPRHMLKLTEKNPEMALAWMQAARELGAEHFLEGYFKQVFDLRYLLELTERYPEVALASVQIARELVSGRLLESYGDEYFERAFDVRYLFELTKKNPEAALTWMQMVRELGAGRFLERYSDEYFEQAFAPRGLLKLSERNPEIALAWMQMAQEFGAVRFLERYGEEYFERAFDPRHLLNLAERNPEMALAWMQMVRELGAGRFLERYGEEYFKRAFDLRYLLDLTRMNPEIALAWMQTARELGAGRFLERYGDEYFERAFDSRHLLDLTERNPEMALAWMQMAQELGAGQLLMRASKELFQYVFSPSYLERQFHRNPKAFAAILLLTREVGAGQMSDPILQSIVSFLREAITERSFLSALPLSILADLKWLAHTAGSAELYRILSRLSNILELDQTPHA